jgi:riboflavin synthase
MFTGLIEFLGTVRRLDAVGAGRILVIAEPALAPELAIGESVAVNGACLTVVQREAESFHFQVGPETLARTNLGRLTVGDLVNLERSLRLSDRLGGHFVQGHIDGMGTIASRQRDGDWELVWVHCAPDLTARMASKGSVAVDGISLTLVDVTKAGFSVALIPHTLAHTTLGRKAVGSTVNLETDLLAKYVFQWMKERG